MRGKDIALSLITARETAKQVAKELVKPINITVTARTEPAKVTEAQTLSNIAVGGFKEILDRRGEGELTDLLLITSSSSYKLRILKDGESLYNDSYSTFQNLSNMVDDIEAHPEVNEDGEETGKYMLSIKHIKFLKRLRILLEPTLLVAFTINTLYYSMKVTPKE